MKGKTLMLILQILTILLLSSLTSCLQQQKMESKKNNHSLDYILGYKSSHKFSTNPLLSDYVYNQTLMDHTVGTLTRFESNGRYENYLLDNWSSSVDGKRWTFVLKKKLETESGESITASSYLASLKRLLKIYHKQFGDDLIFRDIEGYNNFTEKNKSLSGVKLISEYTFEFLFSKKPVELIENLSMPYYGYYSSHNFQENGNWKSNDFIDSSGPYILKKFNIKSNTFTLSAKNNWPLNKTKPPQIVNVYFKNFKDAIKVKGNTIIYRKLNRPSEIPNGFSYIAGTPISLTALILSPSSPAFKNQEFRSTFRSAVQRYIEKNRLKTLSSQSSIKFFPSFSSSLPRNNELPTNIKPILKIYKSTKQASNGAKYSDNLIRSVTEELGYSFKYDGLESKTGPQKHKILSENKSFDIRVGTVIADYEVSSSMIKMMFCSKMGISFTDPSGRICKLTEKFDNSNTISLESYLSKFQKILEEDASVIPLYRSSDGWLYKKSIRNPNLSSVLASPRFEQISID